MCVWLKLYINRQNILFIHSAINGKMKYLVIFVCIASTGLALLEQDREQWVNFKSKHGKLYQNVQEEKLRLSIFLQNLRSIEEHNRQFEAGNATYAKGINHFADLTEEEFVSMLKHSSAGRPNLERNSVYQKPAGLKVPDSIDWRDQGAVSPVKDQGDCGSCWAFSVTGTLESFNYQKTKQMVTYSEQQLIDCDRGNYGCEGGDEPSALQYVVQHGIQSESTYPYEKDDRSCRYNNDSVALRIKGYVLVTPENESDLVAAVGTLGAVSVALDATHLRQYVKGVFTDNLCASNFNSLNHAVLAVGYGTDPITGLDYWLVKNSWGDWGEAGYFRIKRGSNTCGIATEGVYPDLS